MIKPLTISIICMLCIVGVATAATFGVDTVVCVSSWYCTAFSEGSCGTRTCVDTNVCGTNINKPAEYLQCAAPSSGGSGSGNSGSSSAGESSGYASTDLFPQGYFTTDTDVIPVSVDQETVTQKIITINTTMPGDYILEIQYPSSYTRGTDFITTSINNKSIEYNGDFNIIIDARNILTGTYILPIKISNKYYSKTIQLIVDVASKESANIELYVDSKIKNIGLDKDITANLKIKGVKLWAGENVTYTILDPVGNTIQTEDRTIIDPSNIEETIALPANMGEGYYTLNIQLQSGETVYSKSIVFTVFTPNKYTPVLETPQKNNVISKNIIWIIIIAVVAVLLILNALTADRPGRRRVAGRTLGRRLMMSRPLISISFNAREKMRNIADKIKIRRDLDEKHQLELVKRRNEILRGSYEKGFISLSEYSSAIHSQGPPTEYEKEHIRREEERHKREIAERKLKEERLLEEKRKEEEKKRLEEEKKERDKKEAEERREKEKRDAEEKKEREEKRKKEEERRKEEEETVERREKEQKRREDERRREIEKRKEESEKEEKDTKRREEEHKKEEEEKLIKILEKREEKIIEKIVEKIDKEEDKKDIEERHEKEKKEEEYKKEEEKHKDTEKNKEEVDEPEKKHEHYKETESKVEFIPKKSEILDKRVKDQEAFVLNSNELLFSLRDLLNVLPHMPEHVLHHHIKRGRNDFANWIGDVFHYDDIAEEVRKADNREDIIKVLQEHQ